MVIDYSSGAELKQYSVIDKGGYYEIMQATRAETRVALFVTKGAMPSITSIIVERTANNSIGWMSDVHDFNMFLGKLQDYELETVSYWINRLADNITFEEGERIFRELKHRALVTKICQRWFKRDFDAIEAAIGT